MFALVASLIAASAQPGPSPRDLSRRLGESAAAAQALQGPLDGTWTLADVAGRPILVLEITDPAGGGPLQGAWREAGGPDGRMGLIGRMTRSGGSLSLALTRAEVGPDTTIRLHRRSAGRWTGWIAEGGRRRAAILSRSP